MTQARLGATIGVVACVAVACGAPRPIADLEELYRSRQWFELRPLVREDSSALIRGAVADAFNDPALAERLLRGVIRSEPRPANADDAYALLSQAYIRSGQYERFVANFTEWAAAFPDSETLQQERGSLERFADRPNQINPDRRHVVLRHDDDSFSLPVVINGITSDFLFDTGAAHSVLTERRAKALGLTMAERTSVATGASGMTTNFRTAVAREVAIGEMRFSKVSFAVLTGGEFADADAGIVGMPILVALGAVRWSRDGTVEVGSTSPRGRQGDANLAFDRGRLLLRTRILERNVMMTLDTGATTTDLNANFADVLPEVAALGKEGTHSIIGAGGTRTFDSLEIPEVVFAIGLVHVGLRPAHLTRQRIAGIGGDCCVGNAGHDLLVQKDSFTIDFGTMTLELR
jgi:clan AA aspartic protease (TIGR02281 family)